MQKKPELATRGLRILEPEEGTGIVLDTHAFIWLLAGDQRLNRQLRGTLERAAKTDGLFVPAIGIWEIGRWETLGLISFSGGSLAWIRRALLLPGIHLAPLEPEISLTAANLSDFYGNPEDRLIAATALYLGFPLATANPKLKSWFLRRNAQILSIT